MSELKKDLDAQFLEVLLKHVDKGTILRVIKELEEVHGEGSFRETLHRILEKIETKAVRGEP